MKQIAQYILGLQLLTSSSFAQVLRPDDWKDAPKIHSVPSAFGTESAVIIEDKTTIRYKYEDNDVYMYKTYHRIIKVIDEKGLESFNKLTVPVYNGQTLEIIKARTILPRGTVLEVPKEKMKESKGEDGSTEIAIALDGMEIGAEVEFLTCYKREAVLFGEERFQFGTPVMHASLEIICPPKLKFEEKGYNGFPTVKDTVIDSMRVISVSCENIPSIGNETYSFQDVNRARAEYKLSYYPDESGNVRQFTWQDLAKKLYGNVYKLTGKEEKAVDKYLETIGIHKGDKEEDKIRKIESAIKTGVTMYKEISDDDAWKLENIISNKSATESGMIRLFAACFLKSGVSHELGLVPDRHQHVFDVDFENWNNLDNYLFYFPNEKKFLSPNSPYLRYPYVSTDVLYNKGLFCKLTTLGEITNALADFHTVQPQPVTESQNNITAEISFNADMDATATVTYAFKGYNAIGVREPFVLLPKEKIKELVQNIASLAQKPENLVSYTVSGEAFGNYYDNNPLLINATVKAPELVEKAGPKYLFKIGDVIGRQSELYENDKRKLPIDMEFPHSENRFITVNIPDGYKILNPEVINITAEFKDPNGNPSASFYSNYKIEGNKLIVNIAEIYTQVHLAVSDFEAFRKVINASADFNKVTLLLGKM